MIIVVAFVIGWFLFGYLAARIVTISNEGLTAETWITLLVGPVSYIVCLFMLMTEDFRGNGAFTKAHGIAWVPRIIPAVPHPNKTLMAKFFGYDETKVNS